MLQVALAGLLAGSLALSPPDGTGDDKKTPNADKPTTEAVATPGVFETAAPAQGPQTITQDTYAFGVPSDVAPFKIWASYGLGEAKQIWDRRGESAELQVAGTDGNITTQRINLGGQINLISLPSFKIGGGAQITFAKNEFNVEDGARSPFSNTNAGGDLESDFGAQGVKVFGSLRGRTLGLHGGYIFDLGDDREFDTAQATIDGTPFGFPGVQLPVSVGPINRDGSPNVRPTATVPGNAAFTPLFLPTALSTSDGRDAIFFGADFDIPSDRFRVFGGIDYFLLQNPDVGPGADSGDPDNNFDGGNDDYLNFLIGAGFKFSVFELGASLQLQTRFGQPTVEDIGNTSGIGGHAGTVSPYLRISPPSLPVSLFVKGAVQEEYTEFGYAIGGGNSVQPSLGFTAGLSIGFE